MKQGNCPACGGLHFVTSDTGPADYEEYSCDWCDLDGNISPELRERWDSMQTPHYERDRIEAGKARRARMERLEAVGDRPDGFRARRKRPEGWLEQAIADGSVRDPNAPPEDEIVYPESTFVISVPLGELSATMEE